jgi:glycosyltransferase involved in cell wall biosynthesis
VVIPTLNGGRLFDRVLAAAASQDCSFEYDVLVLDSGSTDRTAEVASKLGGRVWLHTIDPASFQHGRTRNLGVELTDGDIVAFLTQDALPGDRLWLSRLVEGFDASERTGLVFGRHRAYPAHGLFAANDLDRMFDLFRDIGPVFSNRIGLPSFIAQGSEHWRRLIGFHSDNNSALLRAAWKQIPYPEIDWGEDQVLGWEMVRQGFDKAYADQAVVFHSHQRPAAEQLQVGIEEGRLYKREFGVDLVGSADVEVLLAAMAAADAAFADAVGSPQSEGALAMRAESQRLALEGRLKGAAMEAWGWGPGVPGA